MTSIPPLVVAVPLAVAALLAIFGPRLPRVVVDAAATLTATWAAVGAAVMLAHVSTGHVVSWIAGWEPHEGTSVGIALVVDRMGAGLALTVAVLTVAALIFSWRYFDDVESHFHVLVLLFLAGMTGFALTGDLFDMFVFFELMGVVAYALTGLHVEEPDSVQGAVNFGVINSLGAYASLLGVGLLYARTGELGLAQIGEQLAGHGADALVVAAWVLLLAGFLVKAAAVPLHFWLADAHAVAPTPVCVLFSGVMVELGVYAVARVTVVVFGDAIPADVVSRTLLVIGVVTALVGSVMCVLQRHLKRLLAFSTISHVGLFLCAVAPLSAETLGGDALYIVGHAAVKGALFVLAGVVLNRFESVDEHELNGVGTVLRRTRWLWVLAGLALAGLPGFAPWLGKSVAEEGLHKVGETWAPALFVVVSAVTGGAVLRAGFRVFWGGRRVDDSGGTSGSGEHAETKDRSRRTPPTMVAPAVGLLAVALALAWLPGLSHAAVEAAHVFADRTAYAAAALHGAPAAAVHVEPVTAWTGESVALGLASAMLALAGAALAVWGPAPARRVRDAVVVPVRVLRQLHNGHVGDYVAWWAVGVVFLAVLAGVPFAGR